MSYGVRHGLNRVLNKLRGFSMLETASERTMRSGAHPSVYDYGAQSLASGPNDLLLAAATQHQSKHLLHPDYRADLDGLRAIAVLSVVAYHALPSLCPGGIIGVDVFFVISGFLISTIIFQSLAAGQFSFFEFYSRRIRRIFPALIAVLTACAAVGWFVLFPDEYSQLGKHVAAGAGFLLNFVLWGESGYFDNPSVTKPLLHLWSLGIEEQFYIVWPLSLWLAWKWRLNCLAVIFIVAALSFYLNVSSVGSDPVGAFLSPQTRFWELMTGAGLAYVTMFQGRSFEFFLPKPMLRRLSAQLAARRQAAAVKAASYGLNVLSLLGASLIFAGLIVISGQRSFPGWWALMPVAGSLFIISAGPHAWFNHAILSNRILVWVGLISYPLYLWHSPLLTFARILGEMSFRTQVDLFWWRYQFFFAWLTYRFIELPVRRGTCGSTKVASLVVLMLGVGGVGYAIFNFDGLPDRPLIKNVETAAQWSSWNFAHNDICMRRYPNPEAAGYGWWFCMASRGRKAEFAGARRSTQTHFMPGCQELKALVSTASCLLGIATRTIKSIERRVQPASVLGH